MNASRILVVEDDSALAQALTDTLMLSGYEVLTATDGEQALARLDRDPVDMVLTDVQMRPMDGRALLRNLRARFHELPVLIMTAYGTVEQAVEAMKLGAVDYLAKPFEVDDLLEKVERYLPQRYRDEGQMIAEDLRTRELVELAGRVAASDATVMIGGESGTGKEVLARFIHNRSARADGPFIAINCAAIPDNMLEAVLFGYEKGAFTGALRASAGKFEQAQGGTLLLDEISEMSLPLQAKLLRVLQEREVERLGGREVIQLDVRVLATSNRLLREEVAAGRFREDLFYRLNVFPLTLPPLRERPRDILPLANHLMRRHLRGGETLPVLEAEAQAGLLAHRWSGNVRELDNLMQRALILCDGERIRAADVHFEALDGEVPSAAPTATPASAAIDEAAKSRLTDDLRNVEEQMILDALRSGHGSRKQAAEILGISPRTLRYKLQKLREAGVMIPR
ncbi:MAG: sigma-54-dependent Fis family transcriptional regulator [Chromatiaceae bacterium]|nr:sigma-54-dependent Fis family transcriptional regulator [Gammaproteobacteria bacterium]MCP5304568.1 sigma-54-dependent Fis family transcriptional regulator [Chromatiaceae bacterium]MCP5314295.1 sigma-54-dependent Fis family transcriptional regulator [Chromatiaceae bacterium]